MEVTNIRKHFYAQTKKVKAGNSNRKGMITANVAKIGNVVEAIIQTNPKPKRHVIEVRVSKTVIRRRQYGS